MKAFAVLLSAVAAVNAYQFTNNVINPQLDEPFTLTYEPQEGDDPNGPVTIRLKYAPGGDVNNLKTVEVLASDVTGGSATVTIKSSDVGSGTVAFEIAPGDSTAAADLNYSAPFTVNGDLSEMPTEGGSTPTASKTGTTAATRTATGTDTTSAAATTATDKSSSTSSSSASKTSSASNSNTTVPGENAAPRASSPLALILVTIAAMAYFN